QALSDDIYKRLYMVTPNEVEAKILTGIPCESNDDCTRIAKEFFAKGVKTVILTLGKRGVYVNNGTTEAFVDNYDVEVLDTTGAGDAFNGGLLAGLGKGMKLMDAAAYGNVVSNLAVTRMGTAPAMPYSKEIDDFIAKNGLKLRIK
ncbi:MAG: PfkB family carbohydrate kinase, partial [Angelakisella sp.]